MLKDKKPVPIAFFILSGLYFVYVIASGSSRMIGDEVGGDPGGMILPLVFSIFMFIASVYLLITDKRTEKEREAMSKSEKRLFVLTLALSIAYILCIRRAGFIPCTVLLLFCLCFVNQQGNIDKKDWKFLTSGCVASLVNVLLLYTLGRFVTRNLLSAGRKGIVPLWIGSPAFTASLTLVITTVWIVAAVKFCRKKWPANGDKSAYHTWLSVVIATASTEIIYLVFKQLFLVELVKGFIFW
ncbi:tripartite tricarboxylate transporter TctB family protein [Treponema parvum]|uniref:Tripartite tricarboxylate transporter TctB family protein n=1 Tax=Treponema parvum TaxID=138851 RepID=A0A975IF00_9SPIR|nr:tripartite tricarboxylate transporter TctB family protein [Treponema parvum]QTQ13814.1 tripartite tricarboxylate transporter TctB family protein [Treponema parvum]